VWSVFSVFRTGSLPWCQRLHSSGPFESHPRRGLERIGREGEWKGAEGEREIARYGRWTLPRCSRCAERRGSPQGRKELLELGIFTRPRLGQAKRVCRCKPRCFLSAGSPHRESEEIGLSRSRRIARTCAQSLRQSRTRLSDMKISSRSSLERGRSA